MFIRSRQQAGFALPTVLIVSVVMLTIMTVSVTSVATVRTTLKEQYYEQLAKAAGEAGVEYAKACLAKNENVPQWSDESPLTPATDCTGGVASGSPSPYIVSQDGMRSSFRVGMPALDGDGKAVSISQTGYVELVRESDGAVWRTYRQPSSQLAVVPDLCSGAATPELGWRNVSVASTQDNLTGIGSSAVSISADDPAVQTGYTYMRKDFYVSAEGYYRATARTNSGQTNEHTADIYINDTLVVGGVSGGQYTQGNHALGRGCHTVTIRTHNQTLEAASSRITAAIYHTSQTTPVVETDSSWKVNTGELRHFSEVGYNISPGGIWLNGINSVTPAEWTAASSLTGNTTARQIRPPHDYSGGTSPNLSYFYFISPEFTITGSSNAEVILSAFCTPSDLCDVYVDGSKVLDDVSDSSVSVNAITLAPGKHHVGIVLYNSNSWSRTTAAVTAAVVRGGTTLVETGTGVWLSPDVADSSERILTSYDIFHRPSPSEIDI